MHSTTQNVLFYVILAENILFNIFAPFSNGDHTTQTNNLITDYFVHNIAYLPDISTFFIYSTILYDFDLYLPNLFV